MQAHLVPGATRARSPLSRVMMPLLEEGDLAALPGRGDPPATGFEELGTVLEGPGWVLLAVVAARVDAVGDEAFVAELPRPPPHAPSASTANATSIVRPPTRIREHT